MEGFFTKKETQSISRPNGRTNSCASCGRSKHCASPKLEPTGNGQIMHLMAAPTIGEDKRGKLGSDSKYKLLSNLFKVHNLNLSTVSTFATAIRCYSKEKRNTYQFECCRKFLLQDIKQRKPKVIIVYGRDALFALIGHRWTKSFKSIDVWRGYAIPDQELGCWIVPTFSLTYVEQDKYHIAEVLLKQDIDEAIACIDKPFPIVPKFDITYLKDDLSVFNKITNCNISFDYETTGLKPHKKGHRIVCASVATSLTSAYVFHIPVAKNKLEKKVQKKRLKPFTDLLLRENVAKVAHHKKFESRWSQVILGTVVKNWKMCTQIACHVLNSIEGSKSLKFQGYVRFGIMPYDEEIEPYLWGEDDKNANSFNTIYKLEATYDGLHKLMTYCAWDSIIGFKLAEVCASILNNPPAKYSPLVKEAYQLLHDTDNTFLRAEEKGMRIDINYVKETCVDLNKKIRLLEMQFKATDFFKKWSRSSKNPVKISSDTQLREYIYGVLKIKPIKYTKKGAPSTDADTLGKLGLPDLNYLIRRQKLLKIRDFLLGYEREAIDGILHPFFNLTTVRTYRTSSNNPNFQNIPKRDEFAMKMIRGALFPSKGNQLLEMDFSGVEVGIATCYHKDPMMVKYVSDPTTDMHGDMAAQIYMLPNFDRHKKEHNTLRKSAKNGFVFPQFYGDYYVNCASNLCNNWIKLNNGKWTKGSGIKLDKSITIGDHLIKKGINTYKKFVKHIQEIEKDFWYKRFPVYTKWKNREFKRYCKQGYLQTKMGFTIQNHLTRNQAINHPIQGTASHCLDYTMNQVDEVLQKRGMKTRIIGQIHDAVVFDIYPPELVDVYKLTIKMGTKKIKKRYPWINVPLSLDGELCDVDESWATKYEVKLKGKKLVKVK